MTTPTVLSQDDELLIKWLPGTSRHLVLAFTGIRHQLGGLPMDEFIGTASDNASNHVLFISDLKRSWYSSARLMDKIVEAVTGFIAKHNIANTVAIGNSMGGYGAILFAELLPVSKVVAFVPQVSMHPDVLLETRWIKHRPYFGAELPPSLAPVIARSKAYFFLFFGVNSEADAAHAALLSKQPRLSLFMLQNCGHDVGAFLKNAGLLTPVFADIFNANGIGLPRILKGHV